MEGALELWSRWSRTSSAGIQRNPENEACLVTPCDIAAIRGWDGSSILTGLLSLYRPNCHNLLFYWMVAHMAAALSANTAMSCTLQVLFSSTCTFRHLPGWDRPSGHFGGLGPIFYICIVIWLMHPRPWSHSLPFPLNLRMQLKTFFCFTFNSRWSSKYGLVDYIMILDGASTQAPKICHSLRRNGLIRSESSRSNCPWLESAVTSSDCLFLLHYRCTRLCQRCTCICVFPTNP